MSRALPLRWAMVMLIAVTAVSPPASAEPLAADDYIVQLAGDPLAFRTPLGTRLDAGTPDAREHRSRLASERGRVLATVPGVVTSYDYDTAFNGFSASLTSAQVRRLRANPDVVAVTPWSTVKPATDATPAFLGLSGDKGVWDRQFGDPAHAGEGAIIGVIDTGYLPEHPSFAALPEPRPDADVIAAKWKGTCQQGTVNPVTCNNKVIGARYYQRGESSPRDLDGHGTHVASTAAGNHGVPATFVGGDAGTVSGVAPAARLAIYNVDHSGAIVKAIDDAVADGVDVLNYSAEDVSSIVPNPTDVAFLGAARAGVFVAEAATNNGPTGRSTKSSPWTTAVAASSHDRDFAVDLILGDGRTVAGRGLGTGAPAAPLVYGGAIGKDGANASVCAMDSLDEQKATGRVVVCDGGEVRDYIKLEEVQRAGGVGVVVANKAPGAAVLRDHE